MHAQNPEEVREMILRTHDQYDNRNQLVSYAFSLEHKVYICRSHATIGNEITR